MVGGRVALVTGASRGIGRAIAVGLAADGFDVAVNYRRDDDAARETVAGIEALGRRAIAYRANVEAEAENDHMVQAILADFGHIDTLINNAGVGSRYLLVAETPATELMRVLGTNAIAAHVLCRLVLPSMRSRPRGDIIMISSTATDLHLTHQAPYNMAKAALEELALTLANEELDNGIHVHTVAPGMTVTDLGDKIVRAAFGLQGGAADLDPVSSFGRLTRPEDVADSVRFLVSDAARNLTGQRIQVHGGRNTVNLPAG